MPGNTLQARFRRHILKSAAHFLTYHRRWRIVFHGDFCGQPKHVDADDVRQDDRDRQRTKIPVDRSGLDVRLFIRDVRVAKLPIASVNRTVRRIVYLSAHGAPGPPPASDRPAGEAAFFAIATRKQRTTSLPAPARQPSPTGSVLPLE